MGRVLRPVIEPPKLHCHGHLSLEAQRTMAALEQKYMKLLQVFQDQQPIREPKPIDPSRYYESIYNANFKKAREFGKRDLSSSNSVVQKGSQYEAKSDIYGIERSSGVNTTPSFMQSGSDRRNMVSHPASSDVMLTYRPTDEEIAESIFCLTQRTSAPDSPFIELDDIPEKRPTLSKDLGKDDSNNNPQSLEDSFLFLDSPEMIISPTQINQHTSEQIVSSVNMFDASATAAKACASTKTASRTVASGSGLSPLLHENSLETHKENKSNAQNFKTLSSQEISTSVIVDRTKSIQRVIHQNYENPIVNKSISRSPITMTPLTFWCMGNAGPVTDNKNPCVSPAPAVENRSCSQALSDGANFDLNVSDFEFDSPEITQPPNKRTVAPSENMNEAPILTSIPKKTPDDRKIESVNPLMQESFSDKRSSPLKASVSVISAPVNNETLLTTEPVLSEEDPTVTTGNFKQTSSVNISSIKRENLSGKAISPVKKMYQPSCTEPDLATNEMLNNSCAQMPINVVVSEEDPTATTGNFKQTSSVNISSIKRENLSCKAISPVKKKCQSSRSEPTPVTNEVLNSNYAMAPEEDPTVDLKMEYLSQQFEKATHTQAFKRNGQDIEQPSQKLRFQRKDEKTSNANVPDQKAQPPVASDKVTTCGPPRPKKAKTGFKPPVKTDNAMSLSQVEKASKREVINYDRLNEQKQHSARQSMKSSHQLALSFVYTNGDSLCTMFYSAADHAKKRTAGWSDNSVKHVAVLSDNKCYLIPPSMLKRQDEKDMLLKILSIPDIGKMICNCKDFLVMLGCILNVKLDDIPCSNIQDPLIASWLLDPEQQPNCFDQLCQTAEIQLTKGDCDWVSCLFTTVSVMAKLEAKLRSRKQWKLFMDIEMKLVPILAQMETRAINIDMSVFVSFSNILKSKLSRLEQKIYKEAGHIFTINSHVQLRQVLYEELKLDKKLPPNTKIGKTNVAHLKSTSEASLNTLVAVHPLPALVLEYRQLQKLKSTYVEGMMSCVNKGTLSTHWDQTAAATGRLTSSQPNIQAVPKAAITISDYEENHVIGSTASSEADINVREPFISSKGYQLLAADFQQIELRVLAHLSEDSNLLSTFWKPDAKDVFIALTSKWQNKPMDSVTFTDREQTKRVVYSVMYGIGKEKLAEYLKVTADVAKSVMSSFLTQFPAIDAFTKKCSEFAKEFGYTETICGRKRYFPHINSPSPVLRAQAQRQAVNFCVQGSAADTCKLAMIAVEKKLEEHHDLNCKLLLQIHDELIWEVQEDHMPQIKVLIQQTMENTSAMCGSFCKLQVPLVVSLSSGRSWADLSLSESASNKSQNEDTSSTVQGVSEP